MRYQSPTQLALRHEEFYPPFPFPPGASRGGDGSPHGANYAPPPARWVRTRTHSNQEALAGLPASKVQHHLVLGMAPLAGFEVITDGRF